jgi:hypothetical protein
MKLGMTPEDHISNRRPRLVGLVLLVAGLLAAKWQIYDPIHAPRQGMWIVHELLALGILLPPYGLLLLLFGRRPNEWFKMDPSNLSLKSVAYLLLVVFLAFAVFFLVVGAIERQGFVLKHIW